MAFLSRENDTRQEGDHVVQKTRADLSESFLSIEKELNIVARENFWCCQSCGLTVIDGEGVKFLEKNGEKPIGYVFYHEQDKDDLDRRGQSHLCFGSFKEKDDDASTIIGDKITDYMIREGFDIEWNGDVKTRILVKNIAIDKTIPLEMDVEWEE